MGLFSRVLLAILVTAAGAVSAADLLPPDRSIEAAIDHYIEVRLTAEKVTPAPLADDANLIRRTTLDLIGRIPTAAEAQAYVQATDADKRGQLVDRLLASAGFARHQANEFNTHLMYGSKSSLRDYLLAAFQENRSWDRVFREVLLPTDDGGKREKDTSAFLKSRVVDLDRLTNEVSVAFFGINVSCAQCHDHPLVSAWTQEHFYGMKSFFSRTFDNGGLLGERGYGMVKYKTSKGEPRDARLMFLTGEVVAEPVTKEPTKDEEKQEKELLEKLKKDKQPPPAPAFSRRHQLVETALKTGEQRLLATAVVNRLWHRLFGRGIVTPIDQMHPENKPSHPELLDWLARDLVDHQYDLRRTIRGMVLSRTYARSSRWESGDRPDASLFAVGSVRPLKPAQYSMTLAFGSANPDNFAADLKPDELEKRLAAAETSGERFAKSFEEPFDDFQISVTEALMFSNSPRIASDVLRDGTDSLVGKVKKMPDRRAAIETAFWSVCSRPPSPEEIEVVEAYLRNREDRLVEAWQQVIWSLLASSECRFNW